MVVVPFTVSGELSKLKAAENQRIEGLYHKS